MTTRHEVWFDTTRTTTMQTKKLQRTVDDRSLQNTQLDVPRPALMCGGTAIGAYVGTQLGGPQGAAVGAAVGTFAAGLAVGAFETFEVHIDRSGRIEVRFETRDIF
jgi:outer membrane lipoprotein SlyB